jgi:hypothetical protein
VVIMTKISEAIFLCFAEENIKTGAIWSEKRR